MATVPKATVLNIMRAMARENWWDWSATEAQTWLENQAKGRGYSGQESTAIALLVMRQWCETAPDAAQS